jgi:hypothetical protein
MPQMTNYQYTTTKYFVNEFTSFRRSCMPPPPGGLARAAADSR